MPLFEISVRRNKKLYDEIVMAPYARQDKPICSEIIP
jgi:hypothetical protein